MADNTLIEWTDATWNPITGCEIVSPGCKRCYAMKLAGTRLKHVASRAGLTIDTKAGPVWNGQTRFNEAELLKPLRWKRPRRIFVCAHGDLFAESVPDEWIDRVFAIMALCSLDQSNNCCEPLFSRHTFQVLTKRSVRMRRYLSRERGALSRRWADAAIAAGIMKNHDGSPCDRQWAWGFFECLSSRDGSGFPLPNVWLGVSAEDQTRADERIPDLLATPAAIRFVSAEPLLGPIDFTAIDHERDRGWAEPLDALQAYTLADAQNDWGDDCDQTADRPAIDWIIVGGESGQGARPMHPDWPRQIRDQCASAGVAFFFKQWGEFVSVSEVAGPGAHHRFPDGATVRRTGKKLAGRQLDGIEHNDMPEIRP